MPDWSEHSSTIITILVSSCGGLVASILVLGRWAWTLYQRNQSAGLTEVALSVRDLGAKLQDATRCWAQRFDATVERLTALQLDFEHVRGEMGEIKTLCLERHGVGRRAEDHWREERIKQLEADLERVRDTEMSRISRE